MKRIIVIIMTFLMVLVGCKQQQPQQEIENKESVQKNENEDVEKKSLVVYFSCVGEQYQVGVITKGNTAIVAEMIQEKLDCDIFEVVPEGFEYPKVYNDLLDVAKEEQNNKARPSYDKNAQPDLSEYDIIYIGAPVWWGDWPMIMYSFFEDNESELSNKTLIPFSTHGGSGLAGFDKKLESTISGATVLEGLAIAGTEAQNDRDGVKTKVNNWLVKVGG